MAYYDLITVILKPLLLSSMKPCDSVINIAVVYARMNLIMNVLTLKPLVSQKSELFPSILPNYIRFMIKILVPSKISFILPFIKACPFYDKNIKDRLPKYLIYYQNFYFVPYNDAFRSSSNFLLTFSTLPMN